MKIERIDENSIRCTLTSLDLSTRNINLRDMTYGSIAARRLFSEMMQRAQSEVGFEPDNTPLMIEAIPLQGGSVQLIITKVTDPEELDTRFSKFSQNHIDPNGFFAQLASEILEGAHDIMKQMKEGKTSKEELEQQKAEPVPPSVRIYRFDSLDKVIEAAVNVAPIYQSSKNKLYKNPENGKYYLVLYMDSAFGQEVFTRASNILSEYASKINGETLSEAYYMEHFEVIVKEDALARLASI